jgi:hypothetical protein
MWSCKEWVDGLVVVWTGILYVLEFKLITLVIQRTDNCLRMRTNTVQRTDSSIFSATIDGDFVICTNVVRCRPRRWLKLGSLEGRHSPKGALMLKFWISVPIYTDFYTADIPPVFLFSNGWVLLADDNSWRLGLFEHQGIRGSVSISKWLLCIE